MDPTNVAWIGASNTVNLKLGVHGGDGLSIEAYVNNLFDNGTLVEAAQDQNGYLTANPAAPCPPCVSAAFPPVAPAAVGSLNIIEAGLPLRRTIGIRADYEF
ncbi:MAG: TonB-dependent receptor [Proteobacteria bacterium]|nr:TonB-dependent receptor [Pseudomonadota bacterium]